ncbi:MAG: CDP-glycerol:poly(glycerophosphate) glycerophosphotransferase [Herbinix sp.]|nr:CDP-glycerol:poly(glycerophosphate) glycerophosphotransferase [Herbinix sp.]
MDNSNFKISIIMPVYNVERYLRACLESVVNQTLEGVEIIVVNDGSKDNSISILNEYEKKHSDRMKVFTTENHGVSHARNYGLARATGEYILFVDSDDFIEKDMCEKLYHKAIRDNNDIVICGRYNVYERENIGELKKKSAPTMLINTTLFLFLRHVVAPKALV